MNLRQPNASDATERSPFRDVVPMSGICSRCLTLPGRMQIHKASYRGRELSIPAHSAKSPRSKQKLPD